MFRGVHLKLLFKKKQIYGHKAEVFPSFYKLIIENRSDESHSSRKIDHLSETELVTLIEFIRSKIKTFNNTLQLRFSLQ